MRRMPLLSTEAIHYQDTQTFKELELAFRDIMFNQAGNAFDEQIRQNEQLIEAIINNRFKSNCSISFGDEWPCVRIFDEYHNSVLVRNDYREFFAAQLNFTKRFVGGSGGIKAGVNIMNGKLSGLFSELPFTIYLPTIMLKRNGRTADGWSPGSYRLTSEEMAAVVLHEIGHFFTYCETFTRTVTTNQALAAMVKELDGNYAVDKREVIIARTVDDLKLKDVDIKALAKIDKRSILETAIVTEVAELSRSEIGISIYDTTASEQLADQFASRFGAGVHLMTALNKFHDLFGGTHATQSTPLFVFMQILSIALMFIPPFTFFMVPINIIGILIGGFGDDGDNTYDTPEVRFRRIKMDTIARLKNRAISAVEKKRTLADLEAMEKAMEGVKDKREWREYIATTIIPVYRRYRKTKMLQQQLEQLANNPLFVRAAELSVLL